ncbi:hypothetical protein [Mesorhizobium sp. B2-4-19]|uniref:hypothetical protein n=1 Tax=Mesorhizobium sp. B2-4-19 TaxID=2589930 RepID=UPI0015E2E64B|nr:hypothetical protein [Mesorhizobium sp. B2-4-19]
MTATEVWSIKAVIDVAGTGVDIFAHYSAGAAAMTAAARHFALNAAVAEAYAGRYRLCGDINQAMIPMCERIAGQQVRM